jgi:hypothetical protein
MIAMSVVAISMIEIDEIEYNSSKTTQIFVD